MLAWYSTRHVEYLCKKNETENSKKERKSGRIEGLEISNKSESCIREWSQGSQWLQDQTYTKSIKV